MTADLDRLRAVLAALPDGAEEAVGLLLTPEPRPSGYDSTPDGHLAFAWTGGDGVHFSMPGGRDGPVAMTVPMAFEAPVHLLSQTLRGFLALGLRTGFYRLDGLADGRRQATLAALSGERETPLDPLERRALGALARAFSLVPPEDPAADLARLAGAG